MPCFLRLARSLALYVLFAAFSQAAWGQQKPLADLVNQQKVSGATFESKKPFQPTGILDPAAARFASKAQFLKLNPAVLQEIYSKRPFTLSLELVYHGEPIFVDLVQAQALTEDFSVITSTSENQAVPYSSGVHYRGIVRGNPESIAAFSFSQSDIMGLFSDHSTNGNMVLGKLEIPGNTDGYILYDDQDLALQNPSGCSTEDRPESLPESGADHSSLAVVGCVRVFFEVDYELFQNKTTVQATVDYLSGAFNQLATLYANEQISTMMSQVFVWITPDAYSTTSSSTVLNQFKAFRTSYNGNLAHLVGLGGNNLGGIAYVNTLCSPSYSYAYSDINATYSNVPTFSWTVEVMTHEMGHNLGSNHTQWCGWTGGALDNCVSTEGGCPPGPAPTNGGTVMSYCHLSSYGINFNNGFGSQPGNLIRSRVQAATCLAATCATPSCAAPTGIFATGTTGTSASISWNSASGATTYTLQWRAVGATTWNVINPATSPTALSGLPANDEIEVSVRSNCGSVASDYASGIVFKTGTSTTGGGGGTGGGGTTCSPPSSLTATATSATSANMVWSAVSGALSYQVSWKTAAATSWGNAQTVTGTSYTINGLSASTSYNVRVLTVCSTGQSGYTTASFNTPASGGGGTTCNAPANLVASATNATTASVSWGGVSGASAYSISWKTASASVWGSPVTVSATSYTLSNLSANTGYQVRVQTLCNGSGSAFTQTSFNTPASGGGTSCGAPANLTATATGNTTASIAWSAVSGANGYQISWKTASSTYWSYPINISGTAVNLGSLKSGTTYNIRVRAVCGANSSPYSTTTFTTQGGSGGGGGATCTPPASITAYNIQASSASLSWPAVPNATSYQLQIKLSTSSSWFSFSGLKFTSVQVTGLQPSKTYNVKVRAMCSGAYTNFSPVTSFSTASFINQEEWAYLNDLPVLEIPDDSAPVKFELQPNPANSRVSLVFNAPISGGQAEIIDLNGKKCLEIQSDSADRLELDVSGLPAGLYLVRFTQPGKEPAVEKFIKQ